MEAATPTSSLDHPDWQDPATEVLCPLCQYNLRGLSEPRCPECGYQFQWRDVLDPARRTHPYLFEHHPGRRWRSFWKTAFMAMLPWRFWKTLLPVQTSFPRRLLLYWCIVFVVVVLGLYSDYAVQVFREHQPRFGRPFYYAGLSNTALIFDSVIAVLVLAWPWLTFCALMIFQISMHRQNIPNFHAMRCVLYSVSVAFWLGLAMLVWNVAMAAAILIAGDMPSSWSYEETYYSVVSLLWLATLLYFIICLIVSYWSYLRFRHVIPTILSTQLIVWLTLAAVAYWIPILLRY